MMKKTMQIHLEGPQIRKTIDGLRRLLTENNVFVLQTKFGSSEYIREVILGTKDRHPLRQPARGLVRNLKLLIGGSDEEADTIESLERLFSEALNYAGEIEKISLEVVDDVQKQSLIFSDVFPISEGHRNHMVRNSVTHHRRFYQRGR